MKNIILSGMPAAGKSTVANIIAKQINLKYIAGGNLLKEIAAERGYAVTGDEWWDTDDAKRFVRDRMNDPSIDRQVDTRLKELISNGGFVLTSYSLPWLVNGEITVWLEASEDNRAKRMAKRDGYTIDRALNVIKQRDRENIQYYRRIYGYNLAKDHKVFKIVLDVNDISPERIAEIVVLYYRYYGKDV